MVASQREEAPSMCSDPDSHPPIEPASQDAASGHEIGLIVGDGNRCSAYQADASRPTGAGMIVLPDYHGLTGFYRELALRFAEDGIDAVTIDYYGRTAEPPPRDPSFEPERQARQTRWADLQADVAAAAAHLRMRRHVKALFSIGFCFGGRVSFLLGTLPELQMAGVIGFYGWPVGPFLNDTPAPAAVADRLVAPLLGIFGGADQKIPAEDVETFRQALAAAPIRHDIRMYEGAPHSFFDRAQAEHGQAAADAWAAVRGFINAHAKVPG
jgi:carboxymethylenebutenolidase